MKNENNQAHAAPAAQAVDARVWREATEAAAHVVIKHTRVPRDLLGPATPAMKAAAQKGETIAAAIRALPVPMPERVESPAPVAAHADDVPMHHDPALVDAYNKGFEAAHAQQDAAPTFFYDPAEVVRERLTDYADQITIIATSVKFGHRTVPLYAAAPGKADAANAGGLDAHLREFAEKLAASQKPMDPEIAQVLHANLFDLYAGGEVAQSPATSAADAKDAEQIPPLPEMDGPADMDYVMSTPPDWDEDYRKTWQQLQVEHRNKMQWRAYALDLRTRLAAIAASQKGGA